MLRVSRGGSSSESREHLASGCPPWLGPWPAQAARESPEFGRSELGLWTTLSASPSWSASPPRGCPRLGSAHPKEPHKAHPEHLSNAPAHAQACPKAHVPGRVTQSVASDAMWGSLMPMGERGAWQETLRGEGDPMRRAGDGGRGASPSPIFAAAASCRQFGRSASGPAGAEAARHPPSRHVAPLGETRALSCAELRPRPRRTSPCGGHLRCRARGAGSGAPLPGGEGSVPASSPTSKASSGLRRSPKGLPKPSRSFQGLPRSSRTCAGLQRASKAFQDRPRPAKAFHGRPRPSVTSPKA